MNQANLGLMLLRLPAAGPEAGQAKMAAADLAGELESTLPEAPEGMTEAGLFAGILEILAQAGDTIIQSAPEGALKGASDRQTEPPLEQVLQLVREMDIDLDAVAGPFSFVQLPVLSRAEGPSQQPGLSVQPETAAQLLLAEDAHQLAQAARTLVQMRTLQGQGSETANLPQTSAQIDNSSMALLPGTGHNSIQLAQSATSLPATSAEAPLRPGQAEWPTAFAARIVWLVEGGRERADLRLEPPNLGQLTVRVRLDGDQASLSFHSQHGMVREVVESALPRLRELMADAGYTLADVDIGMGDGNGHGADTQTGTAGAEPDTVSDSNTDNQNTETAVMTGDRLFDAYA